MADFLRQGILSDRFREGLRTLIQSPPDRIKDYAQAIGSIALNETDDGPMAVLDDLRTKLGSSVTDFESIAGTVLLLGVEARSISEPDQETVITEAANALSLKETERITFRQLFSYVFERARDVKLNARLKYYLASGGSRFLGAHAVCDLRPIFSGKKPDEELVVLRWEPVVQMELIAKLNDITENHVLLFTSEDIDDFIERLQAAKRRMDFLKKKAALLDDNIRDSGI
jgi:hypothetical protein